MASLSPWITDLVQEEIEAVLAWQTNLSNHIKVCSRESHVRLHLQAITINFPQVEEQDPPRFSNDGSNFRSVVSQTEPGRSEVQVIEVNRQFDTFYMI